MLCGEPVAEPPEALGGVEELAIQVYRRGAGGPQGVSLFRGAPMYELSFGNAEGDPPFAGLVLDGKKGRLE